MKKMIAIGLAGIILGLSGGLLAATDRHPNLTAATIDLNNAKGKLSAAQTANEFDLGGHAAKAKTLIDSALDEVRQAREAADKR